MKQLRAQLWELRGIIRGIEMCHCLIEPDAGMDYITLLYEVKEELLSLEQKERNDRMRKTKHENTGK